MSNQLQNLLLNLGFDYNEALVYLSLIQFNDSPTSLIARRTGIKRASMYGILERMLTKGIASKHERNNVSYYRATEPSLLVEEFKNKHLALKKSLPEFTMLENSLFKQPTFAIYRGKEGLINVMEDTLTTSTEVLCWADTEIAINSVLRDYYPTYIEKKVERQITLRGIFTKNKRGEMLKRRGKIELREVYLVPESKFPFKNEINIYDDKVAIVSHADKIGVIIQNQDIADSQRAIFNLAFEYAKMLD